ncbi:MAG: hypothetical protein ACYC2R_16410 [Burkholderiales bacterium]
MVKLSRIIFIFLGFSDCSGFCGLAILAGLDIAVRDVAAIGFLLAALVAFLALGMAALASGAGAPAAATVVAAGDVLLAAVLLVVGLVVVFMVDSSISGDGFEKWATKMPLPPAVIIYTV